jgi:hypothetical protein
MLTYSSDLPEQIGIGVAAQNLRRFFSPLELDERGLCDTCRSTGAALWQVIGGFTLVKLNSGKHQPGACTSSSGKPGCTYGTE